MANPVRLLRQMTPGGRHALLLRTGLGVALSLGTLGLAHMMPADDLDRPVRTIPAAQAPAFDFGPGHKVAEAAGPEQPAAGSDAAVQTVVLPAAPLPSSRPPVTHAAARPSDAKIIEAKLYPAGVERFDRCPTLCESRDPAVFGAALPPPPSRSVSVAPQEAEAKGLFDGQLKGAMAVIGDGRRMIDGALGSATNTLVSVKDAMLGAITPEY